MKPLNSVTIILGCLIALAVGYVVYLHKGPLAKLYRNHQHLEQQIAVLEKSTKEINATLAAERNTTEKLKTQLSQKVQELQALRNADNSLRQKFDNLEGKKTSLDQKAAELLHQLEESQKQISELKAEIAAKAWYITRLELDNVDLMKQLEIYELEKERISRRSLEYEKQLQETSGRVETLSEKIALREKQLAGLRRTYQNLVQQLNKQISEKELHIKALEDRLEIHLIDSILFDPGNAVINRSGQSVLKKVAGELKNLEDISISVEGHTDNQALLPPAEDVYHDNLGLSVARAAAVARVLRTLGVKPGKLTAKGYSMYRPVASNDTAAGRRKNRRVEIILAPVPL
jgi:chemotaxis protein MotB